MSFLDPFEGTEIYRRTTAKVNTAQIRKPSHFVGTGLVPVRAVRGHQRPCGGQMPARGATDRGKPCPYGYVASPQIRGVLLGLNGVISGGRPKLVVVIYEV